MYIIKLSIMLLILKISIGSSYDSILTDAQDSNLDSYNRVINGENGKYGEFPWLVSLQYQLPEQLIHFCGASVIHEKWILTAAHCLADISFKSIVAVVGEYDLNKKDGHEQRRSVVKVLRRGYKPRVYKNDIALLKLNKSLTLGSQYAAKINVPVGGEHFQDIASVAGWGRTTANGSMSEVLQKAKLPIISLEECRNAYPSDLQKYFYDCQICTLDSTKQKDACQGDSGGPLVCTNKADGKQYACGVVSFGRGCADAAYPGVYTNVTCFSKWISKAIKT